MDRNKGKEHRFAIDFFELSFLIEACIPPTPIARAMFWDNVIDQYYLVMSDTERSSLFEWVNRNHRFERSLSDGNEDCILFNARFNPDNQYIVTSVYEDERLDHECFLMKDRYYTGKSVWVAPEFIESVVNKNKK